MEASCKKKVVVGQSKYGLANLQLINRIMKVEVERPSANTLIFSSPYCMCQLQFPFLELNPAYVSGSFATHIYDARGLMHSLRHYSSWEHNTSEIKTILFSAPDAFCLRFAFAKNGLHTFVCQCANIFIRIKD